MSFSTSELAHVSAFEFATGWSACFFEPTDPSGLAPPPAPTNAPPTVGPTASEFAPFNVLHDAMVRVSRAGILVVRKTDGESYIGVKWTGISGLRQRSLSLAESQDPSMAPILAAAKKANAHPCAVVFTLQPVGPGAQSQRSQKVTGVLEVYSALGVSATAAFLKGVNLCADDSATPSAPVEEFPPPVYLRAQQSHQQQQQQEQQQAQQQDAQRHAQYNDDREAFEIRQNHAPGHDLVDSPPEKIRHAAAPRHHDPSSFTDHQGPQHQHQPQQYPQHQTSSYHHQQQQQPPASRTSSVPRSRASASVASAARGQSVSQDLALMREHNTVISAIRQQTEGMRRDIGFGPGGRTSPSVRSAASSMPGSVHGSSANLLQTRNGSANALNGMQQVRGGERGRGGGPGTPQRQGGPGASTPERGRATGYAAVHEMARQHSAQARRSTPNATAADSPRQITARPNNSQNGASSSSRGFAGEQSVPQSHVRTRSATPEQHRRRQAAAAQRNRSSSRGHSPGGRQPAGARGGADVHQMARGNHAESSRGQVQQSSPLAGRSPSTADTAEPSSPHVNPSAGTRGAASSEDASVAEYRAMMQSGEDLVARVKDQLARDEAALRDQLSRSNNRPGVNDENAMSPPPSASSSAQNAASRDFTSSVLRGVPPPHRDGRQQTAEFLSPQNSPEASIALHDLARETEHQYHYRSRSRDSDHRDEPYQCHDDNQQSGRSGRGATATSSSARVHVPPHPLLGSTSGGGHRHGEDYRTTLRESMADLDAIFDGAGVPLRGSQSRSRESSSARDGQHFIATGGRGVGDYDSAGASVGFSGTGGGSGGRGGGGGGGSGASLRNGGTEGYSVTSTVDDILLRGDVNINTGIMGTTSTSSSSVRREDDVTREIALLLGEMERSELEATQGANETLQSLGMGGGDVLSGVVPRSSSERNSSNARGAPATNDRPLTSQILDRAEGREPSALRARSPSPPTASRPPMVIPRASSRSPSPTQHSPTVPSGPEVSTNSTGGANGASQVRDPTRPPLAPSGAATDLPPTQRSPTDGDTNEQSLRSGAEGTSQRGHVQAQGQTSTSSGASVAREQAAAAREAEQGGPLSPASPASPSSPSSPSRPKYPTRGDWQERWSEEKKKLFYFNTKTKKTTWKRHETPFGDEQNERVIEEDPKPTAAPRTTVDAAPQWRNRSGATATTPAAVTAVDQSSDAGTVRSAAEEAQLREEEDQRNRATDVSTAERSAPTASSAPATVSSQAPATTAGGAEASTTAARPPLARASAGSARGETRGRSASGGEADEDHHRAHTISKEEEEEHREQMLHTGFAARIAAQLEAKRREVEAERLAQEAEKEQAAAAKAEAALKAEVERQRRERDMAATEEYAQQKAREDEREREESRQRQLDEQKKREAEAAAAAAAAAATEAVRLPPPPPPGKKVVPPPPPPVKGPKLPPPPPAHTLPGKKLVPPPPAPGNPASVAASMATDVVDLTSPLETPREGADLSRTTSQPAQIPIAGNAESAGADGEGQQQTAVDPKATVARGEWKRRWDEKKKRHYYANSTTRKTTYNATGTPWEHEVVAAGGVSASASAAPSATATPALTSPLNSPRENVSTAASAGGQNHETVVRDGWKRQWEPSKGKFFYRNVETKAAQWSAKGTPFEDDADDAASPRSALLSPRSATSDGPGGDDGPGSPAPAPMVLGQWKRQWEPKKRKFFYRHTETKEAQWSAKGTPFEAMEDAAASP